MSEYLDYPDNKPNEGDKCLVAWTRPHFGNSYSINEATYINGRFVGGLDLAYIGVFEYKVIKPVGFIAS